MEVEDDKRGWRPVIPFKVASGTHWSEKVKG